MDEVFNKATPLSFLYSLKAPPQNRSGMDDKGLVHVMERVKCESGMMRSLLRAALSLATGPFVDGQALWQ
jgi:hypothetical protein